MAEIVRFLRTRIRRRALLFFLTDLADPVLAEDFVRHAPLLARQHLVVVGQLGSPEVAELYSDSPVADEEVYGRLAGHIRWMEMRAVTRRLRPAGIAVAPLESETMAADVVRRYLEVKRRQAYDRQPRALHRRGAPRWEQLDAWLRKLADDPWRPWSLDEAREFEALYQRASADLARLAAYAAQPPVRSYLEGGGPRLCGNRPTVRSGRFRFGHWITATLPGTFRRRTARLHSRPGPLRGGDRLRGRGAPVRSDGQAGPAALRPSPGRPGGAGGAGGARAGDKLSGRKAGFSGALMTHNTRVTLTCAAGGATWGVVTAIFVFYNGVILGAVAADYLRAKHGAFLVGWLLPHGSVEVPAMLIGAQAGFVLAGALIGRGTGRRLSERIHAVMPDFVTLCFGGALMLVWAGLVEAFFSQYHSPVLPYSFKIAFGSLEAVGLAAYLALAGRRRKAGQSP